MSRPPDRFRFVPSLERLDDRRLPSVVRAAAPAQPDDDHAGPDYQDESAAVVRPADTSAKAHPDHSVPAPSHEYTTDPHTESSHTTTTHPALAVGPPTTTTAPPAPVDHQSPRPTNPHVATDGPPTGTFPTGTGPGVAADKTTAPDGKSPPAAKAEEETADDLGGIGRADPATEQSAATLPGPAHTQSAGLMGGFLPADPAALEQAVGQILDRLDALTEPVADWPSADRVSALWLAAAGLALADIMRRRYRDRLPQWWADIRSHPTIPAGE
jgi:hypothetical protein